MKDNLEKSLLDDINRIPFKMKQLKFILKLMKLKNKIKTLNFSTVLIIYSTVITLLYLNK